jgi:YesN/AraC family two-component response regulator
MGAEDYLIKPMNTDELIKVVKDKLKKQQVIKENIDKLVEEKEYSLRKPGKMWEIGYWMINNHSGTLVWSEAVHQIYGTDS